MDTSNDYKLSITRLNMISVGRMAIKTLIDKSCFESIDDTSSEVINFCNIVENMFYFCVKYLTRKNLLLSRSFLNSRKLTPASVHISGKLVSAGFKAHSEYREFLRKETKRKQDEETQRLVEEEKKRIEELARRDVLQKSELSKLREEQMDAKSKKEAAVSKTMEAEQKLQVALAELQSAHKEQEKIVLQENNLLKQEKIIKNKAIQRSMEKSAIESAKLKRKSECAEAMHSKDSKKHPWHLIKACFGSCNLSHCIPVIVGMETLKHNFARLRAWIRYALLEKKLYDYLLYLHRCQAQILKFYTSNCVFTCQEYQHFINSLLGLKAIDFSIDLKGENLNHFGFYPIDFTPYLQYVQNPLSVLDDLAESCNHDSDSGNTDDHSSILSSSCHWKEKFSKIEKKLKNEVEQKGYLEEMLRVQEDQVKTMEAAKRDAFLEMKQLENVVLELQIQLTLLHEQYSQELAILDSGRTTHLPPPSLSSTSKSPPNLSALNEACSFSASDEADRNAPPPKINANGRNVFESSLEDSHSQRLRMVQPGILILPTEKPFKVGRQELHAKDCYLTPSRRSRPNQIKEGPTCEAEANLISLKAVRFSDGTDSSEEERVDEGEDVLHSDVFLKDSTGENNNKRPVCSTPPVCQNGTVDSPIRLESSGGSPDGSSHHNSTFNSETFDSLEYDNIDTPEVVRRARRGMESHYYQLIRPISLCHEDSEVNNDAL